MRRSSLPLDRLLPLVMALAACSRPPADNAEATPGTGSSRGPAATTTATRPPAAPAASTTAPPRSVAPSAATGERADAGPPALYGIHASLPLTVALHGFDGTLRVLEDTRARKPAPDRDVPMRVDDRYLHARLELLDPGGRPVAAEELWTSLADVRPAGDLRGVFFLKLDPECFASSFCGPDTEMVDVHAGKLDRVQSVDAVSGKKEPIVLRHSVMEDWRTVRAERGAGFEIFQVTSRREVTAYVRYTQEGEAWVKRYKQRKGEDPPGNPGNEELAFDRKNFPALPSAP
jgi:hypothetical protein